MKILEKIEGNDKRLESEVVEDNYGYEWEYYWGVYHDAKMMG